jgi:DNA (cytosine-5)-methyltransferase 1
VIYEKVDSLKDYLTIRQASMMLKVCEATLRRWDKTGKLKAVRHPINGYRLYEKKKIMELINKIIAG